MTSEWQETNWGEIATLEYGKSLKNYKTDSAPIPVYGTNGPIGFTNEALCKHPGVIIGRKGAYRGVHYSSVPFFVIDTAFYLKPINLNELDLKFCYYKLLIQDINRLDNGSAIPSTSRDDFYQMELELPPVDEQLRITKALECLDSKIANLQKQNQTLEKIVQTLFKQWFIDFNFPDENGKPYKDNGGEMAGSELGEIPKKWQVTKLEEIAVLRSGYAFKSSDFVDAAANKVLKIKNLKGKGKIDLSSSSSVSRKIVQLDRVKFFKLEPHDIVLAMSGNTTGKIGLVPIHDDQLFLNQRVGKFFMIDEKYKLFLYLFLMASNYENKILKMGYGTAQPNINPVQIGNIDFIIPSNEVLHIFKHIVEPMLNKILKNDHNIQILTKTRDTLLPKLMSGQIRVSD